MSGIDLPSAIVFQNCFDGVFSDPEESHRIKYGEVDVHDHQLVGGGTNTVAYTSDSVLAINTTGTIQLSYQISRYDGKKRLIPTYDEEDNGIDFNITSNHTFTTIPAGMLNVGGPGIYNNTKFVNSQNFKPSGNRFRGIWTFKCHTDTASRHQFGFVIPVADAFGIISSSHTLTVTDNAGNCLEIVSVLPVYYTNPVAQTQTAGMFVVLQAKVGSTRTLNGNIVTVEGHNFAISVPLTGVAPNPTVTFTVTGNITLKKTIIAGTDLRTVGSNMIVTQAQLDLIRIDIQNLYDNDVALADALQKMGEKMATALDNINSSYSQLQSSGNLPGFAAHDIVSNVNELLVFVASTVGGVAGTALNVIAKLLKASSLVYTMYNKEDGNRTATGGKLLDFQLELTNALLKMKYSKMLASEFKDIMIDLRNKLDVNHNYNYLEYVEYMMPLEALHPNIVKAIEVGIPVEKLIRNNIYPRHSLIVIKEVTSGDQSLKRNLVFNVTDGLANGKQKVDFFTRSNYVNFEEWVGDSSIFPTATAAVINDRELTFIGRGLCVVKYETIVNMASYLKENIAPYTFFWNNCHKIRNTMREFVSTGNLPIDWRGDFSF